MRKTEIGKDEISNESEQTYGRNGRGGSVLSIAPLTDLSGAHPSFTKIPSKTEDRNTILVFLENGKKVESKKRFGFFDGPEDLCQTEMEKKGERKHVAFLTVFNDIDFRINFIVPVPFIAPYCRMEPDEIPKKFRSEAEEQACLEIENGEEHPFINPLAPANATLEEAKEHVRNREAYEESKMVNAEKDMMRKAGVKERWVLFYLETGENGESREVLETSPLGKEDGFLDLCSRFPGKWWTGVFVLLELEAMFPLFVPLIGFAMMKSVFGKEGKGKKKSKKGSKGDEMIDNPPEKEHSLESMSLHGKGIKLSAFIHTKGDKEMVVGKDEEVLPGETDFKEIDLTSKINKLEEGDNECFAVSGTPRLLIGKDVAEKLGIANKVLVIGRLRLPEYRHLGKYTEDKGDEVVLTEPVPAEQKKSLESFVSNRDLKFVRVRVSLKGKNLGEPFFARVGDLEKDERIFKKIVFGVHGFFDRILMVLVGKRSKYGPRSKPKPGAGKQVEMHLFNKEEVEKKMESLLQGENTEAYFEKLVQSGVPFAISRPYDFRTELSARRFYLMNLVPGGSNLQILPFIPGYHTITTTVVDTGRDLGYTLCKQLTFTEGSRSETLEVYGGNYSFVGKVSVNDSLPDLNWFIKKKKQRKKVYDIREGSFNLLGLFGFFDHFVTVCVGMDLLPNTMSPNLHGSYMLFYVDKSLPEALETFISPEKKMEMEMEN